jgi:hypothetical protein
LGSYSTASTTAPEPQTTDVLEVSTTLKLAISESTEVSTISDTNAPETSNISTAEGNMDQKLKIHFEQSSIKAKIALRDD